MTPQEKQAFDMMREALIVVQQSDYGRKWIWPESAHRTAMREVESALIAANAVKPHARDAVTWTPETGYVFAEPKTTDKWESARVADYNRGWNDCLAASGIVRESESTQEYRQCGICGEFDRERQKACAVPSCYLNPTPSNIQKYPEKDIPLIGCVGHDCAECKRREGHR